MIFRCFYLLHTTTLAVLAATFAGCAVGPTYKPPAPPLPSAWVAPLPHSGSNANLNDWWAAWDDAVLLDLVDNAQRENPTVAMAAARIEASRAAATAVGAAQWPGVTANASERRAQVNQPMGVGSSGGSQSVNRSASIDALWEIDLFGSAQRNREAAAARADARTQDWHDARVSVAAEVAASYVNLRACETLLSGYVQDAKSRAETARLTDLRTKAGFTAPADAALSAASAAEAASRVTQQRADCDIEIKALSLVSVVPEPALRERLAARTATFPAAAGWPLDSVPAAALAQRPDVAAAERELAAASADIGVAEADRYPRITLTGAIGYGLAALAGIETRGATWSFGPAISVPIFDAGRRAANVDAAKARYAEALARYQSRATRAVREVEESLVRIVAAGNRATDAKAALRGYETFLVAADAKVRAGSGSQIELEEARRAVVAAHFAVVNIERDRLNGWITLYRAVGGAWQAAPAAIANAATDKDKP